MNSREKSEYLKRVQKAAADLKKINDEAKKKIANAATLRLRTEEEMIKARKAKESRDAAAVAARKKKEDHDRMVLAHLNLQKSKKTGSL